jgi:signal peptidase II
MATRYFVLLAVILAGSDQLTKWIARENLPERIPHEIIPDFFRVTLNYNEGIAWGMLPEWSEYFTYFAIVMVLVILMILRKLDKDEVWLKIALAFQMAGAIGNMADRLMYHKVTDFLDVTLFPGSRWEYDWPIFNLADSYVVVGTVVLVLVLLFARDPSADEKPATERVGGTLEGLPDERGGWEEMERLPGSIHAEEGLMEIKTEEPSEMLVPFEEKDSVNAEELEEPLGNAPEEIEEPPDKPVLKDDKSGLSELSKRPEPGD